MKIFINKYWKTLLFFAITGLVGGFFVGIVMKIAFELEQVHHFAVTGQ